MANWRLLGLFLSLLLVAPHAQAAGTSNDAKERAARKACLRGNAEKGVEILTDLYLDTKDANYIYNQGRCFEQNHRYEDAVSRFREYLLKARHLTEADKAETQRHISDCQSYLGKVEAPAGVAMVPASSAAPQGNMQASAQASPAQPTASIQQPITASSPGSGLRTAGVVTASAGATAIITGLVLNLKANRMSKDLENYYVTSTNSSRETYKTFSQVSYGVGAACLAGGALLYYLGLRRQTASSPSMALVPAVGPADVCAVLGGSF